MTGIWDLLEECRDLGVKLTAVNDQLKVQASKPLPDNLIAALKESKEKVLAEIQRRNQNASKCWALEEWRRLSIPGWRRILKESIEQKDTERENYAREMLRDILEDPDYEENQQ
jgi:hypothetical protein